MEYQVMVHYHQSWMNEGTPFKNEVEAERFVEELRCEYPEGSIKIETYFN